MPRINPTWTTDELVRELGQRLAQHRIQQNLTLEDMAERAGLSRSTVQRAESGENPTLKTVIRLLRAMDMLGGLEMMVPEPLVSPLRLAQADRRRAQGRASGGQ